VKKFQFNQYFFTVSQVNDRQTRYNSTSQITVYAATYYVHNAEIFSTGQFSTYTEKITVCKHSGQQKHWLITKAKDDEHGQASNEISAIKYTFLQWASLSLYTKPAAFSLHNVTLF